MPTSESTRASPGAAVTGTTWGTPSVAHPAASAEATPVGESSIATQSAGSTPSAAAAARYGSGWGLPLRHLVAGDRGRRTNRRRGRDHGVGEATPRHRHQHARDLRSDALGQQLRRTRAPRQALRDAGDDAVEEALDDVDGFEPHAAAGS